MSTQWSRRLGIALLLSLGLNLFLGGILASQWLFEPSSTGGDRALRAFDRRAGLEVLDPAARDRVEAIWQDNRGEIRREARAVREARRALRATLSAEPFDRAAVDAASRQLAAQMNRVGGVMTDHLAEIAAALPPDQRRRYFEATFAGHDRGPRHQRPPGPDGGPPGASPTD